MEYWMISIYANIDLLSFSWVKIVKKYATSENSISSVLDCYDTKT